MDKSQSRDSIKSQNTNLACWLHICGKDIVRLEFLSICSSDFRGIGMILLMADMALCALALPRGCDHCLGPHAKSEASAGHAAGELLAGALFGPRSRIFRMPILRLEPRLQVRNRER